MPFLILTVVYFGAAAFGILEAIRFVLQPNRDTPRAVITLLVGLIIAHDGFTWQLVNQVREQASDSMILRTIDYFGVFAAAVAVVAASLGRFKTVNTASMAYILACLCYWVFLPRLDAALWADFQKATQVTESQTGLYVVGFAVALLALLALRLFKLVTDAGENQRWRWLAAALFVYFVAYLILT